MVDGARDGRVHDYEPLSHSVSGGKCLSNEREGGWYTKKRRKKDEEEGDGA